ncbi:TolC family outer membrane protein [Comamonas flocculans]|uniref:TolC family outer membrane protein n=1 Tax=Comamonas flocculans TaxID=2597701 RepID=A0A5B8RTN2_9BURK|nr:TolC family outer membrane protein [Comamonas flocculans]QEA12463.1 TolC family outer membrane protein [Comamonas flocculans]
MKDIVVQVVAALGTAALSCMVNAQSAPQAAATAGPAQTLPDAVKKAIHSHPEVQARFHDFTSSLEDKNIAGAGWRPRVDAQAWVGHEWRSNVPASPSFDWNRPGWGLTLTQLLYDGGLTSNLTRNYGFTKLSKFYDLRATSESLANEVAIAYLDVQRYRQTRALAENNYGVHKTTLDQIRQRQQSGVGRGVDLEQANARLALAQVNLMTESGNLNDVSQRYRRLVGEYPAATLDPVPATDVVKLPAGTTQDFEQALRENTTVLSKQALVQAAEAVQEMAKANYAPKLQLVASTGRDRTMAAASDPRGNIQSSSIQLLLTYNLYRGGADDARSRQTAAQRYAAQDVRDYTCRNVQQNLSIAWDNIMRLRQQLPFLREHVLATSKVHTAYIQQFQIGQRTLLDLLDTQNELFQARIAQVNAESDLKKYEYQWMVNASQILQALGLAQPYADQQPDEYNELVLPDEVLKSCEGVVPDISNLTPMAQVPATTATQVPATTATASTAETGKH